MNFNINYDMGQKIFCPHAYPIIIKHTLAFLVSISLIAIGLALDNFILKKMMGFSSFAFTIIIIVGVSALGITFTTDNNLVIFIIMANNPGIMVLSIMIDNYNIPKEVTKEAMVFIVNN